MKKWYNIELTREEWEEFRVALIKDGEEIGEPWNFEVSERGGNTFRNHLATF